MLFDFRPRLRSIKIFPRVKRHRSQLKRKAWFPLIIAQLSKYYVFLLPILGVLPALSILNWLALNTNAHNNTGNSTFPLIVVRLSLSLVAPLNQNFPRVKRHRSQLKRKARFSLIIAQLSKYYVFLLPLLGVLPALSILNWLALNANAHNNNENSTFPLIVVRLSLSLVAPLANY